MKYALKFFTTIFKNAFRQFKNFFKKKENKVLDNQHQENQIIFLTKLVDEYELILKKKSGLSRSKRMEIENHVKRLKKRGILKDKTNG